MRYMSKLSTAYSQEPMTSYWALCLTSSVKALKCNYNYKYNYKSLFSFLRQLSMRHCLHLLLQQCCCWTPDAGQQLINISCPLVGGVA